MAIGIEVLKHIRERTSDGKNKNNGRFPGYKQEYIKSLDFKNAGKSAGKVNLRLSGDMMAAMDLLSHKPGNLNIGFENGTEENARADGNIRGTYGNPSPIPGRQRDFLGITKKDLAVILKKFPLKDREESKEKAEDTLIRFEAARRAARG